MRRVQNRPALAPQCKQRKQQQPRRSVSTHRKTRALGPSSQSLTKNNFTFVTSRRLNNTNSQNEASDKSSTDEQQNNQQHSKKAQQQPNGNSKNKGTPSRKNIGAENLGITVKKSEDFAAWYQQLVTKAELIDYYDVSGCYIVRPWAYEIWENVQRFLDEEFKKLGVKNAYFPIFVPKKNLETEQNHIDGFSAEVAWVTHSGKTKLDEPVAVRPTSETVMYPAYSKWIQSHRDLPLKLNQWCNIVRWESKDPTPFIRSREFLWQEGHTAFASRDDAIAEVHTILDLYSRAYENLLACSVIKGTKTEVEKFAGGDFTTTIEGYIPGCGRAIQAATSHHLGQNFSKMFNIQYLDEDSKPSFVFQNSWGFTTRSLGVMAMTHGDDKGLVLPPRVAPIQAVIVPIFKKNSSPELVLQAARDIASQLSQHNIRVHIDDRTNVTPGFKYNQWELKGVPLRIDLGPMDIEKQHVMVSRRDSGLKSPYSWDNLAPTLSTLLETIQTDMQHKAKQDHLNAIDQVTKWEDFMSALDKQHIGLIPWCGESSCEEAMKSRSAQDSIGRERTGAAKSLCVPFEQPAEKPEEEQCLHCETPAKQWVLFGRSY